jgi:hypothetical protein
MSKEVLADLGIAAGGYLAGNILFYKFERHVPMRKRLGKFVSLLAALAAIRIVAGRRALAILLGLMAFGVIILHGWWFPKNGVNGLTAEPYERYLALVESMKGTKGAPPGAHRL